MKTIVIASGNPHKVREIVGVLGGDCRYLSLADYPDAPAADETADTFEANAALKLKALADWLMERGRPGLADEDALLLAEDSGLEVDALHGQPGVHSARFANLDRGVPGNASDADNNEKLLRRLKDVPNEQRRARFRCAIVYGWLTPEGLKDTGAVNGACEGRVAARASGASGFGYDPLFIPEDCDGSFAELGEETKKRISHRARALTALRSVIPKY